MPHLPRTVAAWACTLGLAIGTAQARPVKPPPVPSPSTVAPGPSQTPQLPSGADTGNVKGDNTPRKVLQRRGVEPAASGAAVDDRAAAKAASRASAPGSRPASAGR